MSNDMMTTDYTVSRYIEAWTTGLFAAVEADPWDVTGQAEMLVSRARRQLGKEYSMRGEFAVHQSATIETNAILKGPGIIGPQCFVASGAYLRGGTYLAENCTIGPNSELKSCFMFSGSKVAHLSFVGDSILGVGVNIEAGAIVANYRNELSDPTVRIAYKGGVIDTGVTKFGALIGDYTRIGANAVIAPGALLEPGSRVGRLQMIDQYPH